MFFRKKPIVGSILAPAKVLPINIFLGYLPEVSQKDAKAYSLGIIEKHLESMEIAWYFVFKYDLGYIYEVHEGGAGKAYTPSILQHLQDHLDDPTGHIVYLKTANRLIEVEVLDKTLVAMQLPESSDKLPTEGIVGTKPMHSAVPSRVGFLRAGIVLFITGALAVSLALFARIQPTTPVPHLPLERVSLDKLPWSQWNQLISVANGEYVAALKFENNTWSVVKKSIDAKGALTPEAPNALATPVIPGGGNGLPPSGETSISPPPLPPPMVAPATPPTAPISTGPLSPDLPVPR